MPLKSAIDKDVLNVVHRLQDASFETYIVGGAVRDILLGIKPKDYDIATAATPEQVKSLFRRNARIIGRRFRLVHYSIDHKIFEISTFRREPSEEEKLVEVKGKLRPNENTFGTAEEDAWRRDFTVNAIFYDPVREKITDFTGMGETDLRNGTVRTIGAPAKRFAEDPVRILRALKLAGQYGFTIEGGTLAALSSARQTIRSASVSRLSLEFEKILKNQNSAKIMKAFMEHGFMEFFLPGIDREFRMDKSKEELFLGVLGDWNLRISCGSYRASVSIALSAVCAPFLTGVLGLDDPDSPLFPRWQVEPEMVSKMRSLVHPYSFPRRLVAVSREILMLQPLLLKRGRNAHIVRHSRFHHARELFEILNRALWKDASLEGKWR